MSDLPTILTGLGITPEMVVDRVLMNANLPTATDAERQKVVALVDVGMTAAVYAVAAVQLVTEAATKRERERVTAAFLSTAGASMAIARNSRSTACADGNSLATGAGFERIT